MSEQVRRYDYGYVDDGNGSRYLGLIERDTGKLVRHDDYDALHAEAEALQQKLAAFEELHGGELGLPREGWPAYHKRKMDTMRDLHLGRIDRLEKEAEALRAENGRLQADRDRANQYANQKSVECNTLSSQLEAARGLLLEAAEDIENWGAYARAYFQEKHDLAGCAMKYRMAGTGDQEDGGAEQAAIAAMPLTATLSPEVQASGPYASVAGALAQRYPKPSLLKDCNVSYSNSSRPLDEQGERQEAVAWALANSADEIGGFAPIYYTKEGAISWANGRNIFPLYTTPQPGQDVRGLVSADDVRDACANAVSVFAEEANADQCREVAEYMREVLLAKIAKQQAKGKGEKHE